MIVLPARLTRVAMPGTVTCPARPTALIRPLLTTRTALSTTGPPRPSIRRTPSKTVAAGACPEAGARQAAMIGRASSRLAMTRPSGRQVVRMARNFTPSGGDGDSPRLRRQGLSLSPFVSGDGCSIRVESPRRETGGPDDARKCDPDDRAAGLRREPRARSGERQAHCPESGRLPRCGRDGEDGAGNGRLGVQLRRAGHAGGRNLALPHRHAREIRVQGPARIRRHPDGLGRHLRQRQAGDRAGLGYRRHPAGLPEARRGLRGSDPRGRPWPRRGTQHRHAVADRRGAGREADHGARQAARAR